MMKCWLVSALPEHPEKCGEESMRLSSTGLDEIVLYPCIAGGQTKETVLAMIKTLGACR